MRDRALAEMQQRVDRADDFVVNPAGPCILDWRSAKDVNRSTLRPNLKQLESVKYGETMGAKANEPLAIVMLTFRKFGWRDVKEVDVKRNVRAIIVFVEILASGGAGVG